MLRNKIGYRSMLAIAMLASGLTAAAQVIDDTTIQIVSYWQAGDTLRYIVETGTEQSDGNSVSRNNTSYEVVVTVLESDGPRAVLEWVYSEVVASEDLDEFNRRLVELTEGLHIRYSVSDLGEFIHLENWEDISDSLRQAVALLAEEFEEQPEIAKTAAAILEGFSTREQIEAIAIDEIKLFHALYGYRYSTNEPFSFEQEATNPFGGAPLRAVTTIELEDIDSEYDTAYLIYHMSYDPESTSRALYEAINGMLPEKPLTEEQLAALPAFEVTVRNQFIYHVESGWLLEAYSEKNVVNGPVRRTDTMYIRFLD
jgi:hypothetical protein